MRIIAKGPFLKTALLFFTFGAFTSAGVLENLDRELTTLVESAEPYLVTVEARPDQLDNVFVGSGVLIDNEGYILSTTTVVGGCREAKVTFGDGVGFEASVVGSDFNSGLALLKIDPAARQTPVFGDSFSLKHGSWVIVIGNSYEMPNVVNLGVFSGITDEGFLQLSVYSGPGSSGSAIFNTKGQLVGLLVAQASQTVSFRPPGDYDPRISKASDYLQSSTITPPAFGIELPASGTALAVPVDRLLKVADQLKKYGHVKHGFLGIRQQPLTAKKIEEIGIENGVEIIDIIKDSPASRAGLKTGDILVEFNGTPIRTPGQLYNLVRSGKPGDKIEVRVFRGRDDRKFSVTLKEAPDDGYFGFMNYPQKQIPEMQAGIAGLKDKLGDKIQPSRKDSSNQRELEEYIDKLESKVADLEAKLKEMSDKLNKLDYELTK